MLSHHVVGTALLVFDAWRCGLGADSSTAPYGSRGRSGDGAKTGHGAKATNEGRFLPGLRGAEGGLAAEHPAARRRSFAELNDARKNARPRTRVVPNESLSSPAVALRQTGISLPAVYTVPRPSGVLVRGSSDGFSNAKTARFASRAFCPVACGMRLAMSALGLAPKWVGDHEGSNEHDDPTAIPECRVPPIPRERGTFVRRNQPIGREGNDPSTVKATIPAATCLQWYAEGGAPDWYLRTRTEPGKQTPIEPIDEQRAHQTCDEIARQCDREGVHHEDAQRSGFWVLRNGNGP